MKFVVIFGLHEKLLINSSFRAILYKVYVFYNRHKIYYLGFG